MPAFSLACHACILTRAASTPGSPRRFPGSTTLPYPSTHLDLNPKIKAELSCECHSFGGVLTTLPYPSTHLDLNPKIKAELSCECHSFGGVLEPRYIVGAEPLDQ